MVKDLPAAANHSVLAIIVNLSILGAMVTAWRARQVQQSEMRKKAGTSWTELVQAPIALTLSAVYFFGAFHKLNSSFIDPSVSCAGVVLDQGLRLQGIAVGALSGGLVLTVAVFTIMFEGALAFLFLVPRLRVYGVLFGLGFHFLLSWAHFFDFATFVFALYLIVLPHRSFVGTAEKRCMQLSRVGFVVYVAVTASAWSSASSVSPILLRWYTLQTIAWSVAVAPLLLPAVRSALVERHRSDDSRAWTRKTAAFIALPCVVFLNGLTPYLGLKTVANYTMFSNLRTEVDRTNHLLPVVRFLQVAEMQDDVVDVQEFGVPGAQIRRLSADRAFRLRRQLRWLAEPRPVGVPWIELRRSVLLFKDADVGPLHLRYTRNNVERDVRDATLDPELAESMSWWTRHFLAFRAVQRDNGPVRCRW
jgi:hypothetical protein